MMPPLWLVDTSAWIFALRRNPSTAVSQRIAVLLAADTAATCGTVQLELLGGARDDAEFTRLGQRLRGLHYLPTEEVDWQQSARLAFDLRRRGITVPYGDVLLAALAIRHNATLLHADRDFDAIARHSRLVVESLVDGVSSERP